MQKWWIGDFDVFTAPNLNLTESDFYEMVRSSHLALRYGLMDTFNIAKEHGISVLVASGGIKSIIEPALHHLLAHA